MYTGPITISTSNQFIPSPESCSVAYSCTVMNGPGGHFTTCDFDDGTNYLSFDPSNGSWAFSCVEPRNSFCPPGSYLIRITGTTGTYGNVEAHADFLISLVDPCPTAIAIDPTAFFDATYTLRDETPVEMDYSEDTGTLPYSLSTEIDCGNIAIEFYASKDGSTQSMIPQDETSQAIKISNGNKILTVGYTEETSHAGSYSITYSVEFDLYPYSST